MGLAVLAAARGYSLVCVMPEKMSVDKRIALSAVGARAVITPNAPPSSPDNFRNVARRMAEDCGWFLTDQFRNPANVCVHEETTGAEILEQTDGRVGAFVAGAGTGGTISGVGRKLKAVLARVRIVLADPVGSGLADWVETGRVGPDGAYAVEGIGGSDAPENLHRDIIDAAERVSDDESFAMVKRLVREEGCSSADRPGPTSSRPSGWRRAETSTVPSSPCCPMPGIGIARSRGCRGGEPGRAFAPSREPFVPARPSSS